MFQLGNFSIHYLRQYLAKLASCRRSHFLENVFHSDSSGGFGHIHGIIFLIFCFLGRRVPLPSRCPPVSLLLAHTPRCRRVCGPTAPAVERYHCMGLRSYQSRCRRHDRSHRCCCGRDRVPAEVYRIALSWFDACVKYFTYE